MPRFKKAVIFPSPGPQHTRADCISELRGGTRGEQSQPENKQQKQVANVRACNYLDK